MINLTQIDRKGQKTRTGRRKKLSEDETNRNSAPVYLNLNVTKGMDGLINELKNDQFIDLKSESSSSSKQENRLFLKTDLDPKRVSKWNQMRAENFREIKEQRASLEQEQEEKGLATINGADNPDFSGLGVSSQGSDGQGDRLSSRTLEQRNLLTSSMRFMTQEKSLKSF